MNHLSPIARRNHCGTRCITAPLDDISCCRAEHTYLHTDNTAMREWCCTFDEKSGELKKLKNHTTIRKVSRFALFLSVRASVESRSRVGRRDVGTDRASPMRFRRKRLLAAGLKAATLLALRSHRRGSPASGDSRRA